MRAKLDPIIVMQIDHVLRNKIVRFSRQAHEPLRAHPLRPVREIRQAQDRRRARRAPRPLIPKHVRVLRVESHSPAAGKLCRRFPQPDELLEPGVQLARDGGRVVALGVAVLGTGGPVGPAAVVHRAGRGEVAVVVELADFVAEVDERDAAGAHGDGVGEEDAREGARVSGLEACEGGGGAGYAAVACAGVVLEGDPAREAAGVAVHVEGVEEAAVVEAVVAELEGVFVGEGPADVVVRADVVDPGAALGDVVPAFEGLGEHGYFSGCEGLGWDE